MSLYSALYAGVSGLGAHANAMAAVADNITNINTVGYKGTDAQFRSMVTDGHSKSSYSAGGVSVAPIATVSKQGLLQASSSSTDIAIDGAGFFVTRNAPDAGGDVEFTRAGSFRPDNEGFLRNAAGLYLYGWRLDAQGSYTNTGNLSTLEPVRISDLTGTAQPSTKLQMRANLSSEQAAFTGAYAAGDMASGAVAPHFSRSFDVYDSQGSTHRVTMSYLKTGPNAWETEVYAEPASDVTAAGGLLTSGSIAFNPDGSLDLAGSSPAPFADLNINWTNGAASVPISFELGADGGINGLTQFGTESAMISSTIDGGLLGNLSTIEISDEGIVNAIFDDGSTRAVFQLPIATFQNPDGLTRLSGNAYGISQSSGGFALNAPGSLGAGAISSNALESSNVDLAGEFTNMIRFQRAYSASSKIITTVDDMLREVSDLKR
ncbi:flagellar hook protein FlgE [Stakelama tenebrarum]|uniref:Flagellar hook protein FlgE n=1 Tax=Stakelama tenebrarum TaxID=2711215 RepID=A0A6G6Y4D3_9SPHN|nr:flagellar hook protein FlgE [Sphingosinithalassobacter tenebrarum]QIG79667.1 flagellar hook protein FlgE [Sphingosinithalassobacter tenebrarum]